MVNSITVWAPPVGRRGAFPGGVSQRGWGAQVISRPPWRQVLHSPRPPASAGLAVAPAACRLGCSLPPRTPQPATSTGRCSCQLPRPRHPHAAVPPAAPPSNRTPATRSAHPTATAITSMAPYRRHCCPCGPMLCPAHQQSTATPQTPVATSENHLLPSRCLPQHRLTPTPMTIGMAFAKGHKPTADA